MDKLLDGRCPLAIVTYGHVQLQKSLRVISLEESMVLCFLLSTNNPSNRKQLCFVVGIDGCDNLREVLHSYKSYMQYTVNL